MQPRKHNRYRLQLPVIFSWKDAQEIPHQGVGLTRDISVVGAFVFTASPPPLETDIKLKAFLAPTRGAVQSVRIYGGGHVVRVEPAHQGQARGGFAVAGKGFVLGRGNEYGTVH